MPKTTATTTTTTTTTEKGSSSSAPSPVLLPPSPFILTLHEAHTGTLIEQIELTSLLTHLMGVPHPFLRESVTPLLKAITGAVDPSADPGEAVSLPTLITTLTALRDEARAAIPPLMSLSTQTKRDIDLTSEDRLGWVSSIHATDEEGYRTTTFQRVIPREDHVYGPLVHDIEQFIIFLSHGNEQGATLGQIAAAGEETAQKEGAATHAVVDFVSAPLANSEAGEPA